MKSLRPLPDSTPCAAPLTAPNQVARPETGASANFWLKQLISSDFDPKREALHIDCQLDSISPLGIELKLAGGSEPLEQDRQIHLLEQEMTLRAAGFKRRPIHLLQLSDFEGCLSAAALTELVFSLGQHFHLNHAGRRIYSYATKLDSLTPERLALLKGLGFNRLRFNSCELETAGTSHSRVLRQKLQLLTEFDFPQASWDLHLDTDSERTFIQLERLLPLKPERIDIHGASEKIYRELLHSLRSAGYLAIGNDCFVNPQHPLIKAQHSEQLRTTFGGYNASSVSDWISIGPGGYSQLGNLVYHNSDSHSWRQQQLQQGILPIASGCLLSRTQRDILQIINHLSGCHRLPLHYYQSRYQLNFAQLLEQMPDEISQLFEPCRTNELTLSGDSILYLRQIQLALSGAIEQYRRITH